MMMIVSGVQGRGTYTEEVDEELVGEGREVGEVADAVMRRSAESRVRESREGGRIGPDLDLALVL